MDYQVNLETFRGPLDLLLYLVKRQEVDICDISIARVAEQFLNYLRVIKWVDIEGTGDFLVMAATLMEIKSKLLLPRPEAEADEDDDPRRELVKQLMEYKRFKEAAVLLEAQAERQLTRMPRQPLELPADPDPSRQPLHAVELWDLVSAFGRLMRETLALQPQQIVVDETPLPVYQQQILDQLTLHGPLDFTAIFTPPRSRARLIGMFLAILELIKMHQIVAEQAEAFGKIWLRPAGDEQPALVGPPDQA